MAEGDGDVYNNYFEQVMKGEFDLGSGGDDIKVILVHGHTPNLDTHDEYADVSGDEYGTALGYTAGGKSLVSQDVVQDDANDRGVFDADNPVWAALGVLSPAAPSHAIMYDNTHASDLLMLIWVLGTTETNGGDYGLQWGADGITLMAKAV